MKSTIISGLYPYVRCGSLQIYTQINDLKPCHLMPSCILFVIE